MSAEVVWLVVAGVLAVGEMFTLVFVLGMFSVGALGAAAVGWAGGGLALQLVTFAGTSALLFGGLRPVVSRHRRTKPLLASGVDALVGERATVVEEVGGHAGLVKLKGELWTARTYHETPAIPVGSTVRVVRIEGATAFVDDVVF
jgi:membrane protein implicated in regulation of membrane protease activity